MRLFIALEAPEPLRQEMVALQDRLRGAGPSGRLRWVPKAQMHLTLAFLGEVSEARLPELRGALAEAVPAHAGFEAATAELGGFPSLTRPRVLFLGLAPCAALDTLAADLQARLRAAGFQPDPKPFHPHLTLARVGGEARMGLAEGLFRLPGILPARELVLVRSHLAPLNRHEILGRWALGS
jgi:2'-5' RNA ligase